MKNLYIILIACFSLSLNAQLTQSNHAPLATYTFETYQCDSSNINLALTGANSNWNFSSINTHSSVLLSYFTSTVNNPAYPSATIAVGSSTNNTSYYNSTTTNLNYFGGNISVGSIVAALNYTNSSGIFAVYPMILNSSSTSTTGGGVNIIAPLQTNGTFTGVCKVLVDGYGTLTLPGTNATFTNALRVVTSQTINITTPISPATIYMVNYDYYSVGIRAPLFSISTSTAISFQTNIQVLVTRNKNAVTTNTSNTTNVSENINKPINLNVFPNPSSNEINFNTESIDAKYILITDISGKLIIKQNFIEKKIKLDVNNYTNGLYTYKVINNNNEAIKMGKISICH